METRLPVYKRILFLLILITSIALGIIFISPKFDGDILFGISVGLIASVILISFISPEIRKGAKKIREESSVFTLTKNFFIHPTQIPMTISVIWFVLWALILFVISKFTGEVLTYKDDIFLIILLSPILLLVGFSGLLMIKRKETIGSFGEVHKGSWAVFVGVLAIMLGWGGSIFFILAYIFNW